MDTRLLELLVCPLCKGPLEHRRPPQQERQELICRGDRLAFPVRDGIPVMLESEARAVDSSRRCQPRSRQHLRPPTTADESTRSTHRRASRQVPRDQAARCRATMIFTVLIPARMASTRLPDKPLVDIAGLPMVVRTARRAAESGAAAVVVAADDRRIVDACTAHGVQSLMTSAGHASGSDRLAEACALLGLADREVVVNVQGDEPLIEPALIDHCAALLTQHADCAMGTAAHAIDEAGDLSDPNVVKVVCDAAGRAMYFSRAPIPWWRDGHLRADDRTATDSPAGAAFKPGIALRHVGIYAYRVAFLRRFASLAPSPLEAIESLEQLRALWHGERIAVHVSALQPGTGVDTMHDLEKVRSLLSGRRVPS